MRNFLKISMREMGRSIVVLAALGGIAAIAFAFAEPTAAPTGGAVYAPVNTGGAAQTKSGSFTSAGTVTGNILNAQTLITTSGNVGIGTASPTAPLEVKGGWPAVLVSGDSSPTLRVAGPGSTYKHIELKDTGNGEVWQFSHRPQNEQNRLDIWAFKENSGSLTDVRRLVSMDRNYGVGIGYLPNDIPSGWGGGLVAWDVIAKASVRAHQICLGGSLNGNDIGECRTSWGGGGSFGGMYRSGWSWNFRKEEWDWPYCVYTNPFTGGCSCPSGFSASLFNRQAWARDTKEEAYYCYKI